MLKIKMFVKYNQEKQNSLFYNGVILTIETKAKKLTVYNTGEVTILFPDNKSATEINTNDCKRFKGKKAIKEIKKRKYTDKDIKNLLDHDLILDSNWFDCELMDKKTKQKKCLEIIMGNLNECLEMIPCFIKDLKKK